MFIIIEGIDRSGKSTIAELYKKNGYKIIHMSAPNKKYKQPGYSGPSYLDEILDIYMEHDGQDVVFDRSAYGEFIWPHVYGRESTLSEDDMEILQEFEERNETLKILMTDPDTEAHWKRV
jgi:polyphosphate kinase 2 (PPK2 family)